MGFLDRLPASRSNAQPGFPPPRRLALFAPLVMAIAQCDDPIFLGVVLRSFGWSFVCFASLHVLAVWVVHHILDLHGPLAWVIDLAGSVGASILTLWLFLPAAAAIGMLYIDRVAAAVERRFYPFLQPARGAPVIDQVWDGLALGLKVLLLNAVALIVALLIPGVGFILGWMIAAFAFGRGLFVGVAMRRMPRQHAESLYRSRRLAVIAMGAVLALAAYVPILNLLIPVIGTAAMVHILDNTLIYKDASDILPK